MMTPHDGTSGFARPIYTLGADHLAGSKELSCSHAAPWLGVTSVVEAAGTFVAVFMLAQAFAVPLVPSLLLAALTQALQFSPLLAALVFGLVARHRRVILSQAQRNFGALGDLLTVLLFVFVAASLEWKQVMTGTGLAFAVVGVRLAVKTLATTVFARLSGITWRKGALTGLAMTPISVFVILLLEHTRHLELGALDQVAGVAAIVLFLDVIGPLVTQRALIWAGETHRLTGR